MPSDTCDRCAAVWRAAIERAAYVYSREAGHHPSCGILGFNACGACRRADEIRALSATPKPCDCAARDRVVEAAVDLDVTQRPECGVSIVCRHPREAYAEVPISLYNRLRDANAALRKHRRAVAAVKEAGS